MILAKVSRTKFSSPLKSLLAKISLEISFDPIPTQVTPASNHPLRFSSSVLTPPVGMILVQGCGPWIAFTKPGPYVEPGNSLITSQPSSSARLISASEPQPGDQSTFLCAQPILDLQYRDLNPWHKKMHLRDTCPLGAKTKLK